MTAASMITLTLKEQPVVPLEAEVLTPDVTASLANDAIRALPVYLGKKQCRVEDFFTVEGEASDRPQDSYARLHSMGLSAMNSKGPGGGGPPDLTEES